MPGAWGGKPREAVGAVAQYVVLVFQNEKVLGICNTTVYVKRAKTVNFMFHGVTKI